MAGKLQVSPRNAFDTEQHAWLTDAGVMEDDLWTHMTHEKDVVRQTEMERGETRGLQQTCL